MNEVLPDEELKSISGRKKQNMQSNGDVNDDGMFCQCD